MIALIILFFCLTTSASLSASIWLSKWTDKAKSQIRSNNTTSSLNNQIRDMNIYSALGIIQGIIKCISIIFYFRFCWRFSCVCHAIDCKAFDICRWSKATLDYPTWSTSCTYVFLRYNPHRSYYQSFFKRYWCSWFNIISSFFWVTHYTYHSCCYIGYTYLWIMVCHHWTYTSCCSICFYSSKIFCWAHEKFSLCIFSVFTYRLLDNFVVWIQLHVVRSFRISAKQFKVLVPFEHIMFNSASSMCVISWLIEINRVILLILFLQGMIYHKIGNLYYLPINRWRGICLEMIGILLVLFTSLTAVLIRNRLTAGTVGLMITYAMQVTSSLNVLVRIISDIETNIISVERINEYAELTPEAPWEIPLKKPLAHWPADGSIRYIV